MSCTFNSLQYSKGSLEIIGRITGDMFSDGHGGDIEICSCGSLGHFSDQSNIQVKRLPQAITPFNFFGYFYFLSCYDKITFHD